MTNIIRVYLTVHLYTQALELIQEHNLNMNVYDHIWEKRKFMNEQMYEQLAGTYYNG